MSGKITFGYGGPPVSAMEFSTDRRDAIVALYAWTVTGSRHHVADASFLSSSQWAQLARLIAQATHDRLVLDASGRDNPGNGLADS